MIHLFRTSRRPLTLIVLACLGLGLAPRLRAARPPNILFILSDDHSLQTIGAYRGRLGAFCREHGVTPNIDRLAAEGALFVNSFCGNSLCSPSRASLLTGLHSHAHGVRNLDQPLREGLWTFPAALRDAGYQTAVVGKWHLGKTPAPTDDWRLLPGQGDYWQPEFVGPGGRQTLHGYATDLLTDLGLDWLRRRDRGKPFLLLLNHKAPHRNWLPPPRYYRWLQDVTIPEPDTLFDDYAGRGTPAHEQKMEIARQMHLAIDLKVVEPGKWPAEMQRMTEGQKAEWLAVFGPRNDAFRKAGLTGRALTRWKYQEYMKDYLRCIRAVDDSVGRVMAYLRAEGLERDTVVVYASDQGFYNGEHGWFDKRWIYEESIRMPLIVRWPGVVRPGRRIPEMVQNIDAAATFAEVGGAPVPAGLHGRSLMPLLRGESPRDWRRSVYYHYYDPGHGVPPHYGVRTDRHTLVRFPKTDEWELYDLRKDPHQLRSVHGDPRYRRTTEALREELDRLRQGFQDTDDAGH